MQRIKTMRKKHAAFQEQRDTFQVQQSGIKRSRKQLEFAEQVSCHFSSYCTLTLPDGLITSIGRMCRDQQIKWLSLAAM